MMFPPDATSLAKLLHGEWTRRPPDDWVLSALDSTYRVGRRGQAEPGTLAHTLARTSSLRYVEAAGTEGHVAVLTDQERDLGETELPILRVPEVGAGLDTLVRLGREHFGGTVIAITGSAGKTTTRSMIRQVLEPHLSIYESVGNEPTPIRRQLYGLSGMDREIGLFEVSRLCFPGIEQLLRPHIAVVTSIAEAHMEALGTLEGVASTKSILFEGLAEGGTAIINVDSPHSDLLVEKARQHAARLITYGRTDGADLRMLAYDDSTGEVTVEHEGTELTFTLGLLGTHNALNSLSVLAVLQALQLNPRDHLDAFRAIQPVGGRGDVFDLVLGTRTVTVVDQSHNANPTSMKAALESFGRQYRDRRRVLVLGDMLELGPTAEDLHRGILDAVMATDPAAVLLVGPLMGSVWAHLPDDIRVMHGLTAETVLAALPDHVEDGDALFVKASRGTGLEGIVKTWKSAKQPLPVAWRLVIAGTVQGVGYRHWAQARAREHSVSGWIRNRSDGKVEARVQGSPAQLGEFLGDLHSGPEEAYVKNISTRVVARADDADFRTRRTRIIDQPPADAGWDSRAERVAKRLLRPVRRRLRRRS